MSGTAVPRPGPGRPRDPRADAAILTAAVDLFVERGLARTSIEAIARRAGVAKATVYKRWSTKEDLLAEAIERARDDIPALDEQDPDVPPAELIEAMLPRWGAALADPRYRALMARLLGAGPDHPALLDIYWNHHVVPRRERARAVLRRAQEAGALDADADLDMLIDMLLGAMIHHLVLEPGSSRPDDHAAYLRRLLRQAGLAIGAGVSPAQRS
ncbi:TetR/AcrR family transcriptional regulator [Saccharomonospora piscinae]|uniref:TetR/AcrR family transcriptional regulator n=1 Tax=Saccharomonospora piscinae TaxID=687388 RepID=UPI001106E352|nr:TetR/AcrR family transcriptional regulator [Saccharomonospora piscinae]TLW92040.1 TetR/AcrR family transcriptional regulator [Saccharomonospora piscinae]